MHLLNQAAKTAFRFLLLIGLLSCQPESAGPEVVASSDLGEITAGDLERYILSQPQGRRKPPEGQEVIDWRRHMLEQMLIEQVLEAEAWETRLGESPQVQEILAGETEPLLAATVEQSRIQQSVQVTEEDLRAFYDAHPEEFGHGEQIRLRNIYRRVARDASMSERSSVEAEMEGLLRQLHQGAHFGELAKAHSDSETAHLEGLIGRIDRGALGPSLEEVVWNLEEGEVSDVISTPVGFHVFKVENHIPAFKMDFEEARGRLLRRLTREATQKALSEYFAELLQQSGATYDPAALAADKPETVLLALNDYTLTVGEWRQTFAERPFFSQREASEREQLDEAVRTQLFLWEAKRSQLDQKPEIAAQLAELERRTLVDQAYRERRREKSESVTDEELQAIWASQKERFQTPRLTRLRLLTRPFPADPRQWYRLYEQLEDLAEEIRAGRRDFVAAVRELSKDVTARSGGDTGWIRLDSFAQWAGPRAQKAVIEMAPGDVSDPLLIERYSDRTLTYDRAGYMLVKLEEVQEPRMRTFEEVRGSVLNRYEVEGSDLLNREISAEILESIQARIHDENL